MSPVRIRYNPPKEIDMSEATMKYKNVIKNSRKVIRDKLLPYDAFTISAVVGAAIGVPKETVLDDMLNPEFDK